MYPELNFFDKFNVSSYGAMWALGFVGGLLLACCRAKKYGYKIDDVLVLCIWLLIVTYIGARFYYVILYWGNFSGNLLSIVNPYQTNGQIGFYGFKMQGGAVLVLLFLFIFAKLKKINFLSLLDFIAPSLMLLRVIGRIGCFLNGCCFGKPSNHFWCVVFPSNSNAGHIFQELKIQPTQLYYLVSAFLILIILLIWDRRKHLPGLLFIFAVGFYSFLRFIIDFSRYFNAKLIIFKIGELEIATDQVVALCVTIIALMFVVYYRLRKKYYIVPDRKPIKSYK